MKVEWIYFHTNTPLMWKQVRYICILIPHSSGSMVDIFAYSMVAHLVRTHGQKFKKIWIIIIWNKSENNNIKHVCIIEIFVYILLVLRYNYEIDRISILNVLHLL